MSTFSERIGLKSSSKSLQLNGIDTDLRNGLWSALTQCYWETVTPDLLGYYYLSNNPKIRTLCERMWLDYFKSPIDTLENRWNPLYQSLRDWFFKCQWNQVYDFVEFVANNYPDSSRNHLFAIVCNGLLEREASGYRFIELKVVPIVGDTEIAAIESACSDNIGPVQSHLERALELFGDREAPDYRNSVKESISAVEALARRIAGKDKATLKEALDVIEKQVSIHPALKGAFDRLYGYASDEGGIRHALLDSGKIGPDEARFMLITCSAFINYLTVIATKNTH